MATRKKKASTAPKKPKKSTGASTAPVKVEPFTQQLACALRREEVEERAQRAAFLLSDHDNREASFEEERKAQKAVLQRIENEIRAVSQEVREKVTYRDVPCERRFDYTKSLVLDVRLDTGEVVFERPMSDAEKQRDLFDPPGGAAAADVDDEFDDEPAAADGKPPEDHAAAE